MRRIHLMMMAAALAVAAYGCGSKDAAGSAVEASSPETTVAASADTTVDEPIDSTTTQLTETKKMDKTNAAPVTKHSGDAIVEIKTSEGTIKAVLFGDTPKHRDNFLKLADENYYDGVLFHRVIKDFMVQTGDPDSKGAPSGKMLGQGGPGYTIEAEIVYPKHFHRYGALAAARTADQVNPERRSSGSQFYIVTGEKYNQSKMQQLDKQLQMAQQQEIFNRLAAERRDQIMKLRRERDQQGLQALQEELVALVEKEAAANPLRLTPEQKAAYGEVGGTPHLDNQYTVFGQVTEGMDVVEKIQNAATDGSDRPRKDIRIEKVTVLERP